jgi:ribonuclease HI
MVWQKGLLIKLKKLGLTGRVFSFIENFMTGRTIQIRVGGDTSSPRCLDNGTAQGSVISPLLFLIMINDLPKALSNVETSLFADDSCVFKSGKNLDQIVKTVQENLDKIAQWCDLWGFKINTEKTVAVLFTHRIDRIETNLTINGKIVKVEKTAKFLGVIFDSKLTWNAHIEFIEQKCKKRLNLMRMISGQAWGASKKSLLMIYRALIRSVLDYGSIAYNTASAASKQRLDRIQHAALRIACGAFKNTPVASLEVETGEMPLELRRQQQELSYAIKLKALDNNPAKSVLKQDRLAISHRYTDNNKPFCCRIREFFDSQRTVAVYHEPDRVAAAQSDASDKTESPPWHQKAVKVDKKLTLEVSKKESPIVLKALAMDKIDQYKNKLHIYTDASRTLNGKAAAAFYVPEYNADDKRRLTDNVTIFTAELTAIKLALQWILNTLSGDQTRAVAIFTDSLSSVSALQSGKSICQPRLLADVLDLHSKIRNDITFVWVPSHIGIPGNETVDKLANQATSNKDIGEPIQLGIGEAILAAKVYVMAKWQKKWTSSLTGKQYREIEARVDERIKYVNNIRRKEVTITRLRLGKCRLNAYLHEINVHNNGLCDQCGKPETVHHHIMECNNKVTLALRKVANEIKVPLTLEMALTNSVLLDAIYNNLDRQI